MTEVYCKVWSAKMSYTSFTTEDLWVLISNCGPKPSIKEVTTALCLHLQVEPNDTIIAVVKNELRKHTKATQKMKEKHSRDRTVIKPVESVKLFDEGDFDTPWECGDATAVPMDVDESVECTPVSRKLRRSFGSLQPKQ